MTTRAREVEAWFAAGANEMLSIMLDEGRGRITLTADECKAYRDSISALIAERETAKAELAEAVRVIEPFAEIPLRRFGDNQFRTVGTFNISAESVRAAAAFIAKHPPPQPVPVGEEKGETK